MLGSLARRASHRGVPPAFPPLAVAMGRPHSSSALDWLASFTNYEQRGVPAAAGTDTAAGFDLGRVHRLCAALGDPAASWPAIHVAGTKGKGSVVAMLSSILKESGLRVGTYTSPHLVSLHERIAVGGSPIAPAALDALVAAHGPAVEAAAAAEGGALSHFEILTALAFRHFADEEVDVAVVEAGLGGTRDATNVLPAGGLAAAVVTAIGSDHAEALGGSIEAIAQAKAGIIKPGRPVVVARQPAAAAAAVLSGAAAAAAAPLRHAQEEAACAPTGPIEIDVATGTASQTARIKLSGWAASALGAPAAAVTDGMDIPLGLVGPHQCDNAAAAVTAAAQLAATGAFPSIKWAAVAAGLGAATLPGRFQIARLGGGDAEAGAGAGGKPTILVLDGAHTPEAAEALAATLRAAFPAAPVGLVLAMAGDKDHRGVCAALRALAPSVVVFTETPVAGGSARSAAPGVLVAAWQAAGMAAPRGRGPPVRARELIQASVKAATVKAAAELATQARGGNNPGVVVVTGSLHAVGAALKDLPL